MFVIVFVSLCSSVILIASSGLTKDFLLSHSLFTGIGDSALIETSFILLAIALIPLAYAATSLYIISTKEDLPELIFAPVLVTPLIIYYVGWVSVQSIVFSVCLIVSIFIAMHGSLKELEMYKKINAASIAKKVAGDAILLLNLAVAFAVFYSLFSNPAYSDSQVDSLLRGITGLGVEDIDNITQAALEQQRQSSYAWIEHVEASVQIAVSQNLEGMTADQQVACQNAVDSRLKEIDSAAKSEIDARIGEQAIETPVDTEYIEGLLSILLKWYPVLMAIGIFAILEFLKTFILAPLTWIYTWLLGKIFYLMDHRNGNERNKIPI